MYWLITLGIVLYVAIWGVLTALPARKRLWHMALVRTGTIAASVIVSVPLSKFIAEKLSGFAWSFVEPNLGEDLQKFMGDVPLVDESIRMIVTLLIAPLLCIVLFLLIRGILNIIVYIVERVVPPLRKRSGRNTAIAMPIGAVNGILVAIITLIPLCGYVSLAAGTASAFDTDSSDDNQPVREEMAGELPDYDALMSEAPATSEDLSVSSELEGVNQILDIVEEVGSDPAIKALDAIGKPLFKWMTTGKLKDGTLSFSLAVELPHLTESAGELVEVIEDLEDEDFSKEDKDVLVHAIHTLLESDWVATIFADSVSGIADTWLEGDDFMGVKEPNVGSLLQPSLNVALRVLTTENADTLRQDMDTILEVLTELMAAGFLTDSPDYEHLMAALGENGLLSQLMATLNENSHMAPLATELKSLSVRVVSSVMGETLKNSTEYDPLIDNVADELNKVLEMSEEERKNVIQESVKQAFSEYDIAVPEDVALELSEQAITELGADGEIDSDELKDFLVDHIDEGMDIAGDAFDEDILDDNPNFDPDNLPDDLPDLDF